MSDNCDADGYVCEFEDDIPDVERKFYLKVYPKIDLVAERRVHCTSCGNHIGTAPISEAIVRMHPVLKVTQCRKCNTFYNSGEFEKGEDGSELYCRWCGQGGEVYCCAKCPYVFCKSCIVQNLSKGCVNDIAKNETWNCFSCAPKIMWHLRAQHWALVNFMEKQKKKLLEQNLTEQELNDKMSADLSSCCKNKTKKPTVQPVQKRPSILKLPPAMPKKPLLEKSVKMANGMAKKVTKPGGGSGDEVVCTPDIFSMFTQNEENGAAAAVSKTSVTSSNPPPLLMRQFPGTPSLAATQRSIQQQIAQQQQQQHIHLTLPPGFGTGANASPVYHTINGYRIDLNTAAQQDTFRLPNGKLIQVKKQIPTGNQSPTTTSQSNVHQIVSAPTKRPSYSSTTSGIRPRIMPMNPVRTPLGANSTYVSVRYGNSNQGNTTTTTRVLNGGNNYQASNTSPSTFQGLYQQQQIHHTQQPVSQQQASTGPAAQPAQVVFQRVQHPPTKFGNTRTHFEDKVFGGLEVCHQIIGKINTLTNSSSYKNAKNFRDLKELNIHLSYLFQYAMGRFKGLQEKVVEDIKSVTEVITETEANEKTNGSDGEDLEILEPQTTLIELDSDDDSVNVTTSGGVKAPVAAVKKHIVQIQRSVQRPMLTVQRPFAPIVTTQKALTKTLNRLTQKPASPVPQLPSPDDPKLWSEAIVRLPRAETIYPHLKIKLDAFNKRMAQRQLAEIERPGPVTSKTVLQVSDSDDDDDIVLVAASLKSKYNSQMRRKRKRSDESSDSDWEKDSVQKTAKKKKRVKFADDRSNQSNYSRSSNTSVDKALERPFRSVGEKNDEKVPSDAQNTNETDKVTEILNSSDEKQNDSVKKDEGDVEMVELIDVSDREEESAKDTTKPDSESTKENDDVAMETEETEQAKDVDEPETSKVNLDDSINDLNSSTDPLTFQENDPIVDSLVFEESVCDILEEEISPKSKKSLSQENDSNSDDQIEEKNVENKKEVELVEDKIEENQVAFAHSDDEKELEELIDIIVENQVSSAHSDKEKETVESSLKQKPTSPALNESCSADEKQKEDVEEPLSLPSHSKNKEEQKKLNNQTVKEPKDEHKQEEKPTTVAAPAKEVPIMKLAPVVDVSSELSPPPSPMSPPPSPPNEQPIVNGIELNVGEPNGIVPNGNPTTDKKKPVADHSEATSMKEQAASGSGQSETANDQQLGLEDLIEHGLTSEDYDGFGNVPVEDWNSLMM